MHSKSLSIYVKDQADHQVHQHMHAAVLLHSISQDTLIACIILAGMRQAMFIANMDCLDNVPQKQTLL